jgi:hypothetical protein
LRFGCASDALTQRSSNANGSPPDFTSHASAATLIATAIQNSTWNEIFRDLWRNACWAIQKNRA